MLDSVDALPQIEIALLLTNSESQIEKFAAMYKSLQPKEEFLSFVPPNFDLLQDIRNQGEIIINNRSAMNQYNNGSNGSSHQVQAASASAAVNVNVPRRPVTRQNIPMNNGGPWNESCDNDNQPVSVVSTIANNNANNNNSSSFVVSNKSYASIVKPQTSNSIIGQCVLGSPNHISVKPALAPSNLFYLTFKIDHVTKSNDLKFL